VDSGEGYEVFILSPDICCVDWAGDQSVPLAVVQLTVATLTLQCPLILIGPMVGSVTSYSRTTVALHKKSKFSWSDNYGVLMPCI